MKETQSDPGLHLSTGLVVLVAIIGCLLLSGMWTYGWVNGLRTEGINQETALNAQYLSNQNYLSSYISGFYEQFGIVQYKSDKLDQILTDYAKGRSSGGGPAAEKGSFINAVREAVPDLKGLNVADRMLDYIAGGRAGYRDSQDKLLDMLRSYDKWRADGIVQSIVVKNLLGIPSERLEARIGTQVVHGADARDKMYLIVLTSDAKKAYESGVMEPLKVTPPAK